MRTWNWRKLKDFRPDGHAYFRRGRGKRVYLADCSGETPDQTDDGILIVKEPLEYSATTHLTAHFHLKLANGQSTIVTDLEITYLRALLESQCPTCGREWA